MKMLSTNFYGNGGKGGNLLLEYPVPWSFLVNCRIRGSDWTNCMHQDLYNKMKKSFYYYTPYTEGRCFDIWNASDLYSGENLEIHDCKSFKNVWIIDNIVVCNCNILICAGLEYLFVRLLLQTSDVGQAYVFSAPIWLMLFAADCTEVCLISSPLTPTKWVSLSYS